MKIKILAGFGLVLLLIGLAFAQTPYSNKFFSAVFPAGYYEFSTSPATSLDGEAIMVNYWSVINRAEYIVSYTDFPTPRLLGSDESAIDGQFRAMSDPKYTKAESRIGRLPGHAGFGTSGTKYVYTRAALSEDGLRLWQLEVISPERISLVKVNSFFDSVVIK